MLTHSVYYKLKGDLILMYWKVNPDEFQSYCGSTSQAKIFVLDWGPLIEGRVYKCVGRYICHSRGVQKIQKLSETPATVHRVSKLCINDSKNRKNHEKLVQPVAPHLCMNPKSQKWLISKMSQIY